MEKIFNTNRGKEKFYKIDSMVYFGVNYILMESCKYGDEVPCIIVREDINSVVEWNCYDTLLDWINS